MPGLLPMKVIKVGANAQSRIAQACDRCRSKKIRCDGIRPCCSQCANVGFECKTSDKLSRRAFPRGYTESLEERVRILEAEVREMKDLLDEKDEKIELLSRNDSQSSKLLHGSSFRQPPPPPKTSSDRDGLAFPHPAKDDFFEVQQSPYLNENDDRSDSYFAGTSSTRSLVTSFKDRAQETGQMMADIDVAQLLATLSPPPVDSATIATSQTPGKLPPRLVSDHLVNIFFQEWAPMFPILHQSTFLSLYERYCANAESVTDKIEIAQLNLVFGIAALSNGPNLSADLEIFETQWKAAVGIVLAQSSLATLQVLVLAQLYSIQQGDFTRLLTYKGLSTSLSARLGLHQSQTRFALSAVACETRKRVFWTLYTLDSFTAVMLGLPKHIKDDDVHCEYPEDIDDENVPEASFQVSLPGEPTKVSGALALFRASRVLSRVLEEIFPNKPVYELSLQKLSELSNELDTWYTSLPSHLRLQFAHDKPSEGVTSSRSPILSLVYHYIRALIQRPAICASLGTRSASSLIAMASSCKHIVQIIQLLDERGLSFSFCLNRADVLVLAGIGLLFQGLGLQMHSKILRDNSRTVNIIAGMLQKSAIPCATEFTRIAQKYVEHDEHDALRIPDISRHSSEGAPTIDLPASTRKQLKSIASRNGPNSDPKGHSPFGSRRASFHSIAPPPPRLRLHQKQTSVQLPTYPDSRSEPANSPVNLFYQPPPTSMFRIAPPSQPVKQKRSHLTNLDYLSFGGDPNAQIHSVGSMPIKPETAPSDWEKLLGNLDNGETNIYDACYGGPPVEILRDAPLIRQHQPMMTADAAFTMDTDLWAMCQPEGNHEHRSSILSFSTDEALSSSGEELTAEWASASSSHEEDAYVNMVLSDFAVADGSNMDMALAL